MAASRTITIEQATTLYRAGRLGQAREAARQILRKNRRDFDAHQLLGAIAVKQSRLDDALRHYRSCVSLHPENAHGHYLVGKTQALRGAIDEALESLDRALAIEPENPRALLWKAGALERRGDLEPARALLEPLVNEGAETPDIAWWCARVILGDGYPEEAIAIALRHASDESVGVDCRQGLHYTIGKAYEKLGQYDEAFQAYQAASASAEVEFDRAGFTAQMEALRNAFSVEGLASLPRASRSGRQVIIIAGMPRSGTTLIEQIIAAHPQACGLGEPEDFEILARELPQRLRSDDPFPQCAKQLTQRAVDRMAQSLDKNMRRVDRQAQWFVNKSLENWKLLSLMSLVLPQARVIDCRRDPMDTCFSCYISHILPARHGYASDLRDLGFVYRHFDGLMAHWKGVLDLPVLDVQYEELVAEPEPHIRRIIDFCGLDWDPKCLTFHDSGRVVMSLSFDQVCKPMYNSSIGRWRKYETHLQPLRDALEESNDDL